MIKLLTTYKTAWIGFLVALIASFIMAGTSLAQENSQENPEEVAKKHGVTFPITELGGCSSVSECRSFCEDPVNRNSCVSFAKQKGFYKEQGSDRQQEMLQKASSELGCSSPDECRDFCHQEANFDKCSAFAKKNNFNGGHIDDPGKAEILQKAKAALGCDSPDSCRAICQEEGNRQKCSEFAKASGLRGGEQRVGPGGCTSEETCRAFCSDPANFNTCSSFGGGPGGPEGPGGPGGPRGQFRGPGGCTSEESCRSHCEQNPQDCKIIPGQFSGAGGPIDNPQQAQEQFKKFCSENPDKCPSGTNFSPFSREGRGKFEEFCKDNPDRCRGEGDQFRGFEPRGNPEQFCKENPDKCREGNFKPGEFGGGNPEEFCKNNPDKCRGPQSPSIEGQRGQFPNQERSGRFRPEGFRPPEGTNYSPEGQSPPENFQSPPTSDSGSGGGAPPPSDGGGSGSGSSGSSGGDSGSSTGAPPPAPAVQGVQSPIFNQVLKYFR